MQKGILKRIATNGKGELRTETVEGIAIWPPRLGECFTLFAEPLDPQASTRVVRTTMISHVTEDPEGLVTFSTHNSTYEWRPRG